MSKKILVVDDEPDILAVVIFRLKKLGYSVSMASNGAEAIEAIGKDRPELIIMDIAMPVMDGFKAIKKIREQDKYNDIPIIVLTASRMTEGLEAKVEKVGANHLLAKPFEPAEFISTINKYLPV